MLTLYIFLLLVVLGVTAYQQLTRGASPNAIVNSVSRGDSVEQPSGAESISDPNW